MTVAGAAAKQVALSAANREQMRFALVNLSTLAALLAVNPANAECADPGPAPAIAQGATATEPEMAATHAAVQKFVDALQAYQACLENQIKSTASDPDFDLKQAWRAQGNAAVDLAQDVAADYAEQYKIFKSRH